MRVKGSECVCASDECVGVGECVCEAVCVGVGVQEGTGSGIEHCTLRTFPHNCG